MATKQQAQPVLVLVADKNYKEKKMEQISIEQKMLMTLLGAELAKNGKDFSDLSQLLIDIESTNDVGQIFKIIANYFPKQAK